MATRTRTELKAFFETGDTPTEAQFSDFIDSVHNVTDDSYPAPTIDATPTDGSSNAVSSNGVFDALTTKQAADQDLTDIAGLSPSNDDVLQRKAGAWTNRTIAQLKTDLNVTASPLVWAGKYTTVSASNGIGYGTFPYIYFGAITIPANTVQAGDIIEIKAMFRSNGGGTPGVMIILRDAAAAPASNVGYNVADSSGNKSFASFCSAAGVYHLGFNAAIIAASTGFTAPAAALSHLISNTIYDSFTFQSIGIGELVDTTMAWTSDRHLVFCHTSAAAALVTFMGAWVKIIRP